MARTSIWCPHHESRQCLTFRSIIHVFYIRVSFLLFVILFIVKIVILSMEPMGKQSAFTRMALGGTSASLTSSAASSIRNWGTIHQRKLVRRQTSRNLSTQQCSKGTHLVVRHFEPECDAQSGFGSTLTATHDLPTCIMDAQTTRIMSSEPNPRESGPKPPPRRQPSLMPGPEAECANGEYGTMSMWGSVIGRQQHALWAIYSFAGLPHSSLYTTLYNHSTCRSHTSLSFSKSPTPRATSSPARTRCQRRVRS